ncbi:MAG: phosphatidate cytidylyltransferase [Porticoccaceae bacterium]|nr:phosphatidate cytidylyltransferase [Porticoccaceae bacterium]
MMFADIENSVITILAIVYAVLVLASTIVWRLKVKHPHKDYTELALRVRSWWVMVTLLAIAMVLRGAWALAFFALVSFLALKEFLSMVPTRRADRRVLFWAYLCIPFQYLWVWQGWYGMFIIFIPVYAFLFLPLRMVLVGATRRFLQAAGTVHWGLMMTVFTLSHMAFLLVLPGGGRSAEGAGLVLFLLLLTQFNDVAQYCWGKMLGRRKIVPSVSPNKTWEGFVGGLITTSCLALLLAPVLTPIEGWHSLIAGAVVSIAGFFGDVVISAVKRDIGVKDAGATIPGHGGVLDRVDSLTFTAPLFFHFTRYLYF